MDERLSAQYHFDFRTGQQSAIGKSGGNTHEQRAACTAINRIRARGILEAAQLAPPGESISTDVWSAALARRTREWELPLISLPKLGIEHDEDGLQESVADLVALPSGAEASPYYDPQSNAVYKLFDLRPNGSLGKKISLELNDQQEFEVVLMDAVLRDTLEKLRILNDIGGHPTEIVGLSDNGDYLVAKQPLALPMGEYYADKKQAIQSVRGIIPNATGLRRNVVVVWLWEQGWLIDDLHERNIMRSGEGEPTIIDALVGPVTPMAFRKLKWLRDACQDAECLRMGRPLPERKGFSDVDDDSL